MSQQINLFFEDLHKPGKDFSALNMVQALGVIVAGVMLLYAYTVYQLNMQEQQLEEANKSLTVEQARLAGLASDLSRQRAGLTPEQELKQVEAEAVAQRAVIDALKRGVIGNTRGYSDYMLAFSKQALGGLWLTGFNIEGDATQMSIRGGALNPELVPGYIMRLNNEKVMRGKTFASLQMQLPKVEADKPQTTQYLEFILQSVAISESGNSEAVKK